MTVEMKSSSDLPPRLASRPRRGFLAKALGLGSAGMAAALGSRRAVRADSPAAVTDPAILNFALNLEYLEAEYYTYAVTGAGIAASGVGINGTGTAGPTTVKPGTKVPFVTPMIQQFAMELAIDEQKHVADIRTLLTTMGVPPVAKPAIDLLNSFNLAARLAGLGNSFDPFASETNFLLGSYIFEDVGVSAYHGAAPLIKNKDVLNYAAAIYAVEGYHAGTIRLLLNQLGQGAATDAISKVRTSASGANDDYGVDDGAMDNGPAGTSSIILTDSGGAAFARTTTQVLKIVYLNSAAATPGGFFPKGMNGTIR